MYPPTGPQSAAGAGAAAVPQGSEPQGAAAFLFGVIARRRTWQNFAYLWLAFPLGLFYFVFLVTGLSIGIGLSITLVGIPILLLMVGAWWVLAAVERAMARSLLEADVGPAPRPWQRGEGTWGQIRAHLGDGSTWRDLGFLFLKFPMGLASFVLCVTGLAIVVGFAGAPVFQHFESFTVAGQRVDSWVVAVLFVPLGILALLVWLHVLNGWAWLSARLAEALLGKDEAAQGGRAAAAPQAPGTPAALAPRAAAPYGPPVAGAPHGPQPPYAQQPYAQPPYVQAPYAQPPYVQQPYPQPPSAQPPVQPAPGWVQTPQGWVQAPPPGAETPDEADEESTTT